jgi:hypothetical protein
MSSPQSVTVSSKPRNRSQGGLTEVLFYYAGGYPVGIVTYQGQDTGTLKGTLKSMSDFVTVPFSRAMKAGYRINNPMSSEVLVLNPFISTGEFRTFSNGGWELDSGATVSRVLGPIHQQVLRQPPFDTENLNRLATLEAWAGVNASKSQSWVTAIEAHKSWDTIYQRAKKLAAVVTACRQGNLSALKSMLPGKRALKPSITSVVLWDDDGRPLLDRRGRTQSLKRPIVRYGSNSGWGDQASALWLEYRYGWSPLVYDIIDTMKAIYAADLRHELLPRDIYVSRSQEKAKAENTEPQNLTFGGLQYTGNRKLDWEYTVRCFIHYRVSAENGIVNRLNDFGLFDVPRAVWELVPFSFVADWFIPIGTYLQALQPKIGVEIVDQGFSIHLLTKVEQEISGFPNPTVGGVTFSPVCPLGSKDQGSREFRVRSPQLGYPGFPAYDVKLNIKRMADLVALFKSLR